MLPLAVVAVATLAASILGEPLATAAGLAAGLAGPIAALAGARGQVGPQRRSWSLIAAGLLTLAGRSVGAPLLASAPPPLASFVATLPLVAGFALLAAGSTAIVRRRYPAPARGSWVDAATVTVGSGVVLWVLFVAPGFAGEGVGSLDRVVSLAVFAVHLGLLAVAVRLVFGSGRRSPSCGLLGTGLLSWVGLSLALTVHPAATGPTAPLLLALPSALVGAAALHPSAGAAVNRRGAGMTAGRVALLAAAALLAPATLVVQVARGGPLHLPVTAGGSFILFVLVITRMSGLVRVLESALSRLEAAVDRERMLGRCGAALMAAADRDAMYGATLESALALAGPAVAVQASVATAGASSLHVVATAGTGPGVRHHRKGDRVGGAGTGPGTDRSGCEAGVPLLFRDRAAGRLTLTGVTRLPESAVDGLGALAAQLSLALESAELVEDLHRRDSEQRFRSLVQNASDVITIVDTRGMVTWVSSSVINELGYEPYELVGEAIATLVHADDALTLSRVLAAVEEQPRAIPSPVEARLRHATGEWRHVEANVRNLLGDPNVEGIVLTTRDISERKALEAKLRHQAYHDPLTGLANRVLFLDRVGRAIDRAGGLGTLATVLFVDLDDFKTVNDSLGHSAGDRMIVELANRLQSSVAASDTVARLGGDEFGVLVEGLDSHREAATVAGRLLRALEPAVRLGHKEVLPSASVGIAMTAPGVDAETLLRNADVAMYIAKSRGKGGYEVFRPSMHLEAMARLELKADLQRALDRDEFTVVYQPIVALDTEDIVGAEALVRWQHPERGEVMPVDFIPLAEETGLIVAIGRRVLDESCRQAAAWMDGDDRPFTIGVNVSPRQLESDDFALTVRDALERTGLRPDRLVLELTESVFVDDFEGALDRIAELKALGAQLAIDDFGTGYSSLSYLQRLPVDVLKIDRAFIDTLGGDPAGSTVARGIIRLARTLLVKTVAEGVETPEQLHHLLALDCRLGQGRLFGSADVPEEIGRRLEARDGLPANVLPVSFRGRTSVQGHDLEPSHAVRAAAEPTG